jgi:putative peptidoglycan lipid II flippase
MKKRFVVYAISPLVYNIGIIIGIVFLYPTLGVKGLFWGVILGALLHMSIQIPLIYGSGLLPKFTLSLKVSEIWKVIKVSIPRTLTISSTQISSFFLVSMASLFQSGSVAVFNLGLNLQSVPLTIVGVSYSSAVFPVLSKYFVEKNKESFLARMIESTKHIIFWSFPITILFVVLRAQIVRTIYGAGNFDWSDTRLTAAALAQSGFPEKGYLAL